MYCEQIHNHIEHKISDEEFVMHMAGCSYCSSMNQKIEQTLSILDIKSSLPENLTASIVAFKEEETSRKAGKINFSNILQIASVIAAGVFLGILLGKNSNMDFIQGKESKKEKSIMEYRDKHHFNVNPDFF
jgi:hypothetical protein